MKTLLRSVTLAAALIVSAAAASANPVLAWNEFAAGLNAGSPFNQARVLAATQLAVFEAVNAIQGGYEPYLGPLNAAAGASADAAAITAAHAVLKAYLPASAAAIDAFKTTTLDAIAPGPAKTAGIEVGNAAAAAILAARANDGGAAADAAWYLPSSNDPYQWQLTPLCNPALGGVNANWPSLRPFGLADASGYRSDPPPALGSTAYAKDFNEVKLIGSKTSTERSLERSDNSRFYAAASPAWVMDMAARQIAVAEGRSMLHTARALALINMAISDAAIASFGSKYQYTTWRPETAIHFADGDGNAKTDADPLWEPFIGSPCFPSYPSNHGTLSGGGAEALRRIYGEGGHAIAVTHPSFPGVVHEYTNFNQIEADISDARVFGGIHFRYDQVAGAALGREVATAVYKGNLRKIDKPQ